MALPKYDVNQTHQPAVQTDFFKHPDEGYLQYQPSTMRIMGRGPQRPAIKQPIRLYGNFVGTKQPYVPTCSEPDPGKNAGCAKWAGCPFKALPYVGPGQLIIEHNGTVSNVHCYDYYETVDVNGRPISQRHYGMDGWKVDTTRTTIDLLGHTPVTNPLGQTIGRTSKLWQKEIADLLPPWWGQLKRKGLPLPPGADIYPELVDPDGEIEKELAKEAECLKESAAPSLPSASRNGRGKRTGRTTRRKRSATASTKPPSDSESSA